MLFMPEEEGSTKGPKYPLKHHSDNDDISAQVIAAALRGFGINESEFFKPKKSKETTTGRRGRQGGWSAPIRRERAG